MHENLGRGERRGPHAVAGRLFPLFVVLALLLGACSVLDGVDEVAPSGDPPGVTAAPAGPSVSAPTLARCPRRLVFQTDSTPRPEHAALYHLTGGNGRFDPGTGRFVGPLAADPSITVEIRSSGSAFGPRSVLSLLGDEEVLAGVVSTEAAVAGYEGQATVGVVNLLDISPRMAMWGPGALEIESWNDVDEVEARFSHEPEAPYAEYLLAAGVVNPTQLAPTFDGTPDRFVAARGALLQQGEITRDIHAYRDVHDEWGGPIETLLLHRAGYQPYPATVVVRLDRMARHRPCLQELVPMIQRAVVDFQRDPATTVEALARIAVQTEDAFWTLEATTEAVILMGLHQLVGNGRNGTIGDFDVDRTADYLQLLTDQVSFIEVPEDLTAELLVSNEFIDEDIGL